MMIDDDDVQNLGGGGFLYAKVEKCSSSRARSQVQIKNSGLT